MGLPTFFFLFFYFFRRHVLCPFVVKKTTDWAEVLDMLQVEVKNIFGALIFH